MKLTPKTFIYNWQELHPDVALELAYSLYNERMEQHQTLCKVSERTRLSLKTIDNLETGLGIIDFANVIVLLKYYDLRLNMTPDCFPGLPERVYEAYFSNN